MAIATIGCFETTAGHIALVGRDDTSRSESRSKRQSKSVKVDSEGADQNGSDTLGLIRQQNGRGCSDQYANENKAFTQGYIVMSTQGTRPEPDKIFGADCDGDIALVIANEACLPPVSKAG